MFIFLIEVSGRANFSPITTTLLIHFFLFFSVEFVTGPKSINLEFLIPLNFRTPLMTDLKPREVLENLANKGGVSQVPIKTAFLFFSRPTGMPA